MTAQFKSKKSVKAQVDRLVESSKSKATKSKIIAISKVCEDLVEKSVTPTIALVVKYLAQDAIKISEQTIYNKREGGNPYRETFDAWLDYQSHQSIEKKINTNHQSDDQILHEKELLKIDDPVLRYQVSILLGEVKGLRNQLNIAREVNNLPTIASLGSSSETIESSPNQAIELDDYDQEVIENLLKGTSNTTFDSDGTLMASFPIKKGAKISSPGLKDALEKLIKRG
ncbi:MAG: gamma-mobile-trio protein GmtX [Marinobacter sp.]|nr:gamma-mobile-trio protein GmtX [Marinobacter sp.]